METKSSLRLDFRAKGRLIYRFVEIYPKGYSARQQKTTTLLVLELDFFRELGYQDCDQGG